MKNFKKKAAALMSVVTALCLTVGTLAVFTDRYQAQTTATAGTLDISLSQTWAADNTAVAASYKPGTALKLNYTLSNKGNLEAEVKEMFVISCSEVLGEGAARQFDLYKEGTIVVDANGNVTSITGPAMPVEYDNAKKVLTYKIADHTIGAGSAADDCYYLVFNQNADNSFQEVDVTVEYMAQALQAENTGADTWAAYANNTNNISQSFTIGGQAMNVVPQLNEN